MSDKVKVGLYVGFFAHANIEIPFDNPFSPEAKSYLIKHIEENMEEILEETTEIQFSGRFDYE